MSKTVSDERITCASCEYRYPVRVRSCPICGTEPLQPLWGVRNKSSRATHQVKPSSSDRQRRPSRPRLWRLIPVVVVLTALMAVTSFLYTSHKRNLPKESGVAGELTATSEQPWPENAGERHIVHNSVKGVQHLSAAELGTAQIIHTAKEVDPVELWQAVKRGSVNAEVALANLYLEGEAVPQNCEQAHMLLSAASMKGSKAADDFLKSTYAERCE